MSNYLAIATVTATLQRILQGALDSDLPGAQAATTRPDGTGANGPPTRGVNLFLYQVTPNHAWRNADLPTRAQDGRLTQRPRIALDLHYLISCYGEDNELEPQRALGSVVSALHGQPIINRAAIEATLADPAYDYLALSNLNDEVESVKLNPEPLSLEELSKLWSVFFQTPYSLSVAYMASVVLIEAGERPRPTLPVITRMIDVEPAVGGSALAPRAPDTVAELRLWLRSDRAVTFDGDGVSAWGDQSGNDFHAEQPDVARRPIYVAHAISRLPALRFDGSDDYLAIRDLNYSGAGSVAALTLFALVRSDNPQRQIVASFDREHFWQLALRGGTAPDEHAAFESTDAGGDSHLLQGTQRLTDGRWRLLCARFEAGATPDKRLFVEGTEAAAANGHAGEALGDGVTRFGMIGVGSRAATFNGARGPTFHLAGDIAELALFDRALSDEERLAVEAYFVERYNG